QRLDAEDSPVLELHLRLVVELKLLASQRAADLAEKHQAPGVKAVMRRGVDLYASAVRASPGEGRARSLQQRVGALPSLAGDRDADAELHVERDAVELDRRLEALLHGAGKSQGACLAVRAGGEEGIFIGP